MDLDKINADIDSIRKRLYEAKKTLAHEREEMDRLAGECMAIGDELGKNKNLLHQSEIVDNAMLDVVNLERMRDEILAEAQKANLYELDEYDINEDESESDNK